MTTTTQYTRKQLLAGECSHFDYYAQFVDQSTKDMVARNIGKLRIKNSKCKHFNDIALDEWDNMAPMTQTPKYVNKLKQLGDFWSLAGSTCILKNAAKQIKKELMTEK